MLAILLFLLAPLIVAIGSLIRGYVLSKLWLWFIVSTFHVAPLGVAQCIGLSLIVAYLTHDNAHHEDSREAQERLVSGAVQMLLNPIIILVFAQIVRSFL